jgi:3-oxoadipate enol-lactonase
MAASGAPSGRPDPCDVAHVVSGESGAPPLVLSNSLGTTLAVWDSVAGALAERRRLIRYDHRGHGGSPIPPGPYHIRDLAGDVLALLDRLGIERASFCGLSIGGMVGLWLAAHAPDRIDRLIVLCSSPHMPPASAWAERAAAVRDAGSVEVIADSVLGGWLTPAYAGTHPEVAARLRSMLISMPADGYAWCCEAIEHMDLRDDLGAIRAPTLVIGGEADPATPPGNHGRIIAEGVSGARLELVPAAHLACVEQPGAIATLILDHLDHEAHT